MKFFATAKVTDEIPSGKSEWKKLSEGALENASGIFSQNVGFLNDALRDAIAIWADSSRQRAVWATPNDEGASAPNGQRTKRPLFETATWQLRFFSGATQVKVKVYVDRFHDDPRKVADRTKDKGARAAVRAMENQPGVEEAQLAAI